MFKTRYGPGKKYEAGDLVGITKLFGMDCYHFYIPLMSVKDDDGLTKLDINNETSDNRIPSLDPIVHNDLHDMAPRE